MSAAFLLLLSTFFMAGGLPAQQAMAAAAQVRAPQADQSPHRQAAPGLPAKSKLAPDAGAHHGFGGVAVPPQRSQLPGLAGTGACPVARTEPTQAERRRANPARAPPVSAVR
ncbi:hypothetical protein GCM10009560_62950 [Nonomuraea longicatena]|uniref:Secreted protein n=1 Tax=Nonomuraea longicatena TaxID=83682 RepID=A0ABP4BB70_9ACTN